MLRKACIDRNKVLSPYPLFVVEIAWNGSYFHPPKLVAIFRPKKWAAKALISIYFVEQSLENTSDVDGLDFYGTLRSNSDPILGGNRHNPADALVVITDCVWGTDAPHLFSQI